MLKDRRFVIVEDEMLLAMDLQMMIEDAGGEVVGMSGKVEDAIETIRQERPDAVSLDMNLNGVSSLPVVEMLNREDIPFVVVSGNSSHVEGDPLFEGVAVVAKPYRSEELLAKLSSVLDP